MTVIHRHKRSRVVLLLLVLLLLVIGAVHAQEYTGGDQVALSCSAANGAQVTFHISEGDSWRSTFTASNGTSNTQTGTCNTYPYCQVAVYAPIPGNNASWRWSYLYWTDTPAVRDSTGCTPY
jgi:hypothetical protein